MIPNEELEPQLFLEIHADKGQSALRLDKFLTHKISNVSRNKIQEAIEHDLVFVNDTAVKASYKVKPLDKIQVYSYRTVEEHEIIPEDIPLDIVYEDNDLLVVNKPPDMVVHPAHKNWSGTLVNALAFRYKDLPTHRNGESKPGLVHRIDKDTSGLLLIAKNEESMSLLAKQFAEHTVERTYWALVWGEPKNDTGTIVANLARDPRDRRLFAVSEEGKHAVTHYKVLERLRYVSLLECRLETGRTHQIRVHMKHIGHTLFGDATYGGNKILKGEAFTKYKTFVENTLQILSRQALHAKTLGFVHPKTSEKYSFDSQIPKDFADCLARWRNYLNSH
jgi:23S rRNA pseudouridine1911/1915/1917 synthase